MPRLVYEVVEHCLGSLVKRVTQLCRRGETVQWIDAIGVGRSDSHEILELGQVVHASIIS